MDDLQTQLDVANGHIEAMNIVLSKALTEVLSPLSAATLAAELAIEAAGQAQEVPEEGESDDTRRSRIAALEAYRDLASAICKGKSR